MPDIKLLDCAECGKETEHEYDPEFRAYICGCGTIWDEDVESETEHLIEMRTHINE